MAEAIDVGEVMLARSAGAATVYGDRTPLGSSGSPIGRLDPDWRCGIGPSRPRRAYCEVVTRVWTYRIFPDTGESETLHCIGQERTVAGRRIFETTDGETVAISETDVFEEVGPAPSEDTVV